MSLMKTVTKMAIGFAMAKGMDAVQKNGGLGELMAKAVLGLRLWSTKATLRKSQTKAKWQY